MLDKIDLWLLKRFDLFVAWNRDRGAADQWDLSCAAGDSAVAVNLGGAVLMAQTFDGTVGEAFLRMIMLGAIVSFAWSGRISIRRYRAMAQGSLVARLAEQPIRRFILLLTLLIPLSLLEGVALDDVASAISILLVDCAMYLKAATPPPNAGDRSRQLVHAPG